MLRYIPIIFFLVAPTLSHALCLENCQQETARIAAPSANSRYFGNLTNSPYQERSIAAGDVKNSVFGDMNIRVGHERVDISTETASSNNTIDASINSTIILGDMNK